MDVSHLSLEEIQKILGLIHEHFEKRDFSLEDIKNLTDKFKLTPHSKGSINLVVKSWN